ncbi:peroxisomal membrane protein 11c [Plakobranchus ocellatus]|uniref:Peroxisomal membrane protein 11c n=1 Tax=Plakobranchus ocellatus TaxID=259542 RepID=A0AAV4DF71_9GAST|nr:peroxisomal membrane protein 11c [Plakobranchus ocellatus]
MSFVKNLSSLVSLLETYRGRDRVIRMLTYVAMFMGSNGKTPGQMKWKTVAGELGACRVILRLFDDIPMLLMNLSTGFGLKEKRPLIRILSFLSSILNQGFYPTEHIAWLRQKKITAGEPMPYLLLGLFIWAFSLIVEIIKSFLKIHYINLQSAKLLKQKELDRSSGDEDVTSSQNAEIKKTLSRLSNERREAGLLLLQSCCDFTNAVSWMPPGFLWAGSLSPRINGIVGMAATVLMFYRNWPPPKLS